MDEGSMASFEQKISDRASLAERVAALPRPVRRIGHLAGILTAHTPPAVLPENEGGIWNIPGSMLYTPSFGARRCVPVWLWPI